MRHFEFLLGLLFMTGLSGCGRTVAGTETESVSPGDAVLREALTSLPLSEADNSVVGVKMTLLPEHSVFSSDASVERPLVLPIQARRQVLIAFKDGNTSDSIKALLQEYRLEAVKVIPEASLVVAQVRSTDADRQLSVNDTNELSRLPIFKLIARLSEDRRVLAAAPNSVMSTLQMRSSRIASSVQPNLKSLGERVDWGISDARIDDLWPRLRGPFKVGVIDLGFANHQDLRLEQGVVGPIKANDHGNHVAGIMCALHNKVGVRGVLDNCTVAYASTQQILAHNNPVEGAGLVVLSALMSDFISVLIQMLSNNPDVKVINLSVGYNWALYRNEDPRRSFEMRNVVREQGLIVLGILKMAASRQVAIVTAAGNDSDVFDQPLDAKWASPFNFAAELMKADPAWGWSSALVVEAHDRQGVRARFSNIGGDISCPGVQILSTLASPADSTGVLDGTSQAAPYCGASLLALRSLLPDLSLRQAMDCIRRSDRQLNGVPALNLKYAVESCAAGAPDDAAAEKVTTLRARADALLHEEDVSLGASVGCKYGQRREFRIAPVADLGDGQGPKITDDHAEAEIRRYAETLVRLGCREPIIIARRFGFDANADSRREFSLAVLVNLRQAGYAGDVLMLEWPQMGDEHLNDLENYTDRIVLMVGDSEMRTRFLSAGR